MTARPVADMLADLIGPSTHANRSPAPAKTANAANREHPCGSAADSASANGLRILRIAGLQPNQAGADSQTFAAVRKPASGLQSQQRRGFSQDSQTSQGCPGDSTSTRVARLLRLGFGKADADVIAHHLLLRDRDPGDRRVSCTECRNYHPPRCGNHQAALLRTPDVGRDLAAMLQRCPGFEGDTT